jgi:hypothetical protein
MTPKQIKALIKRHGGCSKVARTCGVHRTTVFRWQSGKAPINPTALALLTKIEEWLRTDPL